MSLVDVDQDAIERQRFKSFSMPMAATPSLPAAQPGSLKSKRHTRSRSRNLSISLPANINQSPSPSPTNASPSPTPTPTTPSFKRNSHHKRLSSVSTRHESAEIMGVAVPDLPISADANIEKDSIRRRALLALEGKPDSYKEVEIPSLNADDDKPFEFPTKPSFPPGSGLGSSMKRDSFKMPPSAGSNKETLGTLVEEEEEDAEDETEHPNSAPPISSQEQAKRSRPRPNLRPLSLTPETLSTPVFSSNNVPSPGIRSAPLKLKSLSLAAVHSFRGLGSPAATKESFRASSPTTASTTEESDSFRSDKGSFRSSESFRSFRPSESFRSSFVSSDPDYPTKSFRSSSQPLRQSSLPNTTFSEAFEAEGEDYEACQEVEHVGHPSSTVAPHANNTRRPELTLDLNSSRPPVARRSSISYKTSSSQEQQPVAWPEQDRRFSAGSSSSSSRSSLSSSAMWFSHSNSARNGDDTDSVNTPASSVATFSSAFRSRANSSASLSASEQHFLFKSHNALLTRIQDLERTLSIRSRDSLGFDLQSQQPSRPTSVASDFSDGEAFSPLGQLKAERDELKKDVEGWRTRVSDLEKQLGVLAGRMDQERREAWIARSRIGLLDAEKNSMEKLLTEARTQVSGLEKKIEGLVDELGQCEVRRVAVEAENESLKARIQELEEEKEKAAALAANNIITPKVFTYPPPLGGDLSSEADSSTEVETPFDEDSSSLSFGPPEIPSFVPQKFGICQPDAVVEDEQEENEFSYHLDHQRHNNLKMHEFDEEQEEEEEEEDAMDGYEDEEDEDDDLLEGMMADTTTSSFGSIIEEASRLTTQNMFPESPITPATPANLGEMSKTWTFPRLAAPVANAPKQEERQDMFFECLDDNAASEAGSDHSPFLSSSPFSYENSMGAFSKGLQETEMDSFAFDLPKEVDPAPKLGTVVEEEEEEEEADEYDDEESDETDTQSLLDDDDAFGEVGGITITFTPADDEPLSFMDSFGVQGVPVDTSEISPPSSASSPKAVYETEPEVPVRVQRKPVPVYEDEGGLDDEQMFSSSSAFEHVNVPQTPPPSKPHAASISRLPRAVKSPPTTPSAGRNSPLSYFDASPNRRASFIPQRVTSPTTTRTSPSRSGMASPPSPTFIRQPKAVRAADPRGSNGSPEQVRPYKLPRLRTTEDGVGTSTCAAIDAEPTRPSPSLSSSPLQSLMSFSPLSAPRSFFTNLWSSSSTTTINSISPSHDVPPVVSPPSPRPLRYVSKETQLQKLRLRLQLEQSALYDLDVNRACRHCAGELVDL